MATNLNGLAIFSSKLKQAKKTAKNVRKTPFILEKVEIAENEIKSAYSGKKGIVVEREENDEGFTIYAKDKNRKPKIAFEEFGTGFYANGSYPGDLPKITLTFQVKGKIHSTRGWEYYYPNKDTKREVGRVKGWFTKNGTFHIGQSAQSTMYKACKRAIRKMKGD